MRNRILNFYRSVLSIGGFGFLISSLPAQAASSMDSVTEGLNITANAGGFDEQAPSIFTIAGKSIDVVISLLGVLILVMIVYSGFLYVESRGDKEKAAKALKIITYTVAGAVIILTAYALANFVIGALMGISPTT